MERDEVLRQACAGLHTEDLEFLLSQKRTLATEIHELEKYRQQPTMTLGDHYALKAMDVLAKSLKRSQVSDKADYYYLRDFAAEVFRLASVMIEVRREVWEQQ